MSNIYILVSIAGMTKLWRGSKKLLLHPSSIRLYVTTRFSIKRKWKKGGYSKTCCKVQLEAMQRKLQENPHDEANKATLNKALEELQAIEKKKIYDLCLRSKMK
jgi:hypothetical protein